MEDSAAVAGQRQPNLGNLPKHLITTWPTATRHFSTLHHLVSVLTRCVPPATARQSTTTTKENHHQGWKQSVPLPCKREPARRVVALTLASWVIYLCHFRDGIPNPGNPIIHFVCSLIIPCLCSCQLPASVIIIRSQSSLRSWFLVYPSQESKPKFYMKLLHYPCGVDPRSA